MDLSSEEELKIPLLYNFCSPELKKRIRSSGPYIAIAVVIAFFLAGFTLLAWCIIASAINDEIQPEIELNYLLVCPTNRESVFWDLKFDIVNPWNDSYICINSGGFKVSIFPYNQTKLLTKATLSVSPACIEPTNHMSAIGLVEAASSSIQDLTEYLDPTSGTIGLDLKIHKDGYEFVCGDAKVALSSSSSCGSMVGDPFACSYDPHSVRFRWSWVGEALVLLVILVLLVAFLLYMFRQVQS